MALTDPVDTLAYHQSRVLTTQRDMTDVNCAQVAAKVKEFLTTDTEKSTVPESEALWFYGLNHAMALIGAGKAPLQPLDPWELDFARQYHAVLTPKAVRAFYYLLVICTREARHNQSLTKDTAKMVKEFGPEVGWWFANVKGKHENDIHKSFLGTPPDAPIGTYVKTLAWQFYNSKWAGGYGGKKWGVVTDCLVRFVTGEFTAEMMLDTVWTLAHNGGPIFNKGHCYSMYSHTLVRILDVQRSGQVPEAALFDKQIAKFAEKPLLAKMKELSTRYADKIRKYVDWEVVETLGSVHKYPTEKNEQFQKWGLSPEATKAAELAAAQKKAAEEAAALAKAEWHKKWFEVMPNVAVAKIEIDRAA